jgi:hypothetical protein
LNPESFIRLDVLLSTKYRRFFLWKVGFPERLLMPVQLFSWSRLIDWSNPYETAIFLVINYVEAWKELKQIWLCIEKSHQTLSNIRK